MSNNLTQIYTNIAGPLAKLVNRKMDYSHSLVVQFARQLASRSPGEYNVSQICFIYDYLRRNWKYVNDPTGTEYIAYASESIHNGLTGDCDDFAITMASVVAAVGGTTRVLFAWSPLGGHAYAEVFVANTEQEMDGIWKSINSHYQNIAKDWFNKELAKMFAEEEEEEEYNSIPHPWEDIKEMQSFIERQYPIVINYHIDKDNHCWLNLDWTSKYPGGSIYTSQNGIIIYPDGVFNITNFRFNSISK